MSDVLDVFTLLVRWETELWNSVDARLRAATDVSVGRWKLLEVIDGTADCTIGDVVEQLAITVGGASKAVDRVEADGLCERRTHPADRRSAILELTVSGRRVLERGRKVVEAELAARVGGELTPRQVVQLARTLDRLITANRAIDAAG